MKIVAPSILSADFGHLADEIEMINRSNAEWVHIDVMDGVFVPNISIGFPIIDAVRPLTSKLLDVHLMIVEPQRWVDRVARTGAEIMNVHIEACSHLHRTVQQIHDAGMKAGVTLNPATPICLLEDIIEDLDVVQLMAVNPGFGGQSFIPTILRKTSALRDMIDSRGSKALIEIDGGVNATTGSQLAECGADVLVAGSYVFRASNPSEAIDSLYNLR